MRRYRRLTQWTFVLVAMTVVVLVGCNLIQYQFCINNFTGYNVKTVNIVPDGASSWGANLLDGIVYPGESQDIKGFLPGTWMVRSIFDVVDPSPFCAEIINNEYVVTSTGLVITTTNICIDYNEQFVSPPKVAPTCLEIYAAPHYEI